jgi:hypothetical protein
LAFADKFAIKAASANKVCHFDGWDYEHSGNGNKKLRGGGGVMIVCEYALLFCSFLYSRGASPNRSSSPLQFRLHAFLQLFIVSAAWPWPPTSQRAGWR